MDCVQEYLQQIKKKVKSVLLQKNSIEDCAVLVRETEGTKPEGWKPSGKRVKRGLYRTAQTQCINADCNGAANIIRKVATTLGLDLREVGSGELITPLRIRLWQRLKNPRP